MGLPPAWRGLLGAGAGRAVGAPQSRGSGKVLPKALGWAQLSAELYQRPWLVCLDKVDQRKTPFIYMCMYVCVYIYISRSLKIKKKLKRILS